MTRSAQCEFFAGTPDTKFSCSQGADLEQQPSVVRSPAGRRLGQETDGGSGRSPGLRPAGRNAVEDRHPGQLVLVA